MINQEIEQRPNQAKTSIFLTCPHCLAWSGANSSPNLPGATGRRTTAPPDGNFWKLGAAAKFVVTTNGKPCHLHQSTRARVEEATPASSKFFIIKIYPFQRFDSKSVMTLFSVYTRYHCCTALTCAARGSWGRDLETASSVTLFKTV